MKNLNWWEAIIVIPRNTCVASACIYVCMYIFIYIYIYICIYILIIMYHVCHFRWHNHNDYRAYSSAGINDDFRYVSLAPYSIQHEYVHGPLALFVSAVLCAFTAYIYLCSPWLPQMPLMSSWMIQKKYKVWTKFFVSTIYLLGLTLLICLGYFSLITTLKPEQMVDILYTKFLNIFC